MDRKNGGNKQGGLENLCWWNRCCDVNNSVVFVKSNVAFVLSSCVWLQTDMGVQEWKASGRIH